MKQRERPNPHPEGSFAAKWLDAAQDLDDAWAELVRVYRQEFLRVATATGQALKFYERLFGRLGFSSLFPALVALYGLTIGLAGAIAAIIGGGDAQVTWGLILCVVGFGLFAIVVFEDQP